MAMHLLFHGCNATKTIQFWSLTVHDAINYKIKREEERYLPGLCDVIVVLVSQVATPSLEVVPGVHLSILNVLGETVGHGDGLHEQPVVLVGGL